mgnify:CR=1 FL=1
MIQNNLISHGYTNSLKKTLLKKQGLITRTNYFYNFFRSI